MSKLAHAMAVSAFILAASLGYANDKVGDVTKVGDTSYMLVREFLTPEDNENFQRNVEIMRRHARLLDETKAKTDAETDSDKKKELSARLKQIEDEYGVNDKAMQNAYAFAANRNYRMVFLESNICTALSKEELSSLRDSDGKELDPMLISQNNNVSIYRQKVISGIKDNEILQRELGFSMTRRAEIEALRKKLAETTDAQEQLKINQSLVNSEKALSENDASIRNKYSIKPDSEYIIQIGKSKLYLILTPEEALKIEAERTIAARDANKTAAAK